LQLVQILTPNQTEAAALLGSEHGTPEQNDVELVRLGFETLKLGPESVILKLGGAGCAIFSPESSVAIDAFPVNAIDTTAAGDVFNGALAVGLAEDLSLPAAAQFAKAAAAISVTRSGAQTSIPTRAETDAFIRSNAGTQVRDLPRVY
jgi:ribokinase